MFLSSSYRYQNFKDWRHPCRKIGISCLMVKRHQFAGTVLIDRSNVGSDCRWLFFSREEDEKFWRYPMETPLLTTEVLMPPKRRMLKVLGIARGRVRPLLGDRFVVEKSVRIVHAEGFGFPVHVSIFWPTGKTLCAGQKSTNMGKPSDF